MARDVVKAGLAARWEENLVRRPFTFVWAGFLIGAVTFGYLFVPQEGTPWVDAWASRGGAWAIGAWLVALVCMSCGVRGLSLRVYRWRRDREADAVQVEVDEDQGPSANGAG